ncbi:MAG: NAD-dependent epimerase/dehydratase family protein [Magnetococcales bacterium]|nr:GDP-mannose 4,6-dehydratase [Magnetococcales bacterium]NGZ28375.1 NAD-dependent epimerase/dehydratase family protein [Magnetococcales bacterium]
MIDLAQKRILVTGGSGFIASHLCRRLVKMGSEVAILTKYHSIIDNVRVVDIWNQLRVVEVDLRNLDSTRRILDFKPEIIFHLAAYNHVGDSFIHPSEAIDCNLKATVNLINVLEETPYQRFIYISTSEIYGSQKTCPFEEEMTPNPISPYAIGKYGGELYTKMMMEQRGRPMTILRPFNAFGPYQSLRAVIPEIMVTCLRHQPIRATRGVQTREFNFVTNLVDGMILAASKEEALGKIINLGCGEEIAIRTLIETIHELTNSQSTLNFGALPDRPTEIWRMAAANQRAKEILGWTPAVSFREGLQLTLDWFRNFQAVYGETDSPLMRLANFG